MADIDISKDGVNAANLIEKLDQGTGTVQTSAGKKKLPQHPKLGVGDTIGEGDSYIIFDAFPTFSHEGFAALKDEVYWQRMFHASGEVPRLVCCQGDIHSDGSMPVYRHPSDQSLPLLQYSPLVQQIKARVEEIVHHPMNHVLIQLYRSGEDYISEHSDKTLDVVRGSSIVNVSLGSQRTMRLRTKKSGAGDGERQTQLVPMPHRSVFVLGPESNMRWLHGIKHDKRPAFQRSPEETAFDGQRISLTFRNIGTFLNKDSTHIWGQGALSKEKADAHAVINGDKEKTQELVNAFGFENQQSVFDWDAIYGRGFDVLHFQQPVTSTGS